MKSLLLTALLAFTIAPALADPLVVEPNKLNVPAVAQKCVSGCIVIDAKDFKELQEAVQSMAQEAFEAGVAQGKKLEKGST